MALQPEVCLQQGLGEGSAAPSAHGPAHRHRWLRLLPSQLLDVGLEAVLHCILSKTGEPFARVGIMTGTVLFASLLFEVIVEGV